MGRKTKLTPELQKQIVELISSGVTIETTCLSVGIGERTYYDWRKRGETELLRLQGNARARLKKDEERFSQFSQETTRAQGQSNVVATVAFRKGMMTTDTVTETTETISETRVNPRTGEVYEHRRTITKRSVTKHPPDWRAGEAWLKRRDRENWSEKAIVEIEDWRSQAVVDIRKGIIEFEALAEAFDHDLATELFKQAGITVSESKIEDGQDRT